jgi:hypothetical protein
VIETVVVSGFAEKNFSRSALGYASQLNEIDLQLNERIKRSEPTCSSVSAAI